MGFFFKRKLRKKSSIVAILLLAMISSLSLMFQNCAKGGFEVQNPASDSSDVNSAGGDTTQEPVEPPPSDTPTTDPTTPPPVTTAPPPTTTPPITTSPTGPTAAEIRLAECKKILEKPSFTSQSLTGVSVVSGNGSKAGDKTSGTVALTLTRGIKDNSIATQYSCGFITSSACSVVKNDATRPLTIEKAIDSTGTNLYTSTLTEDQKATIVTNSIGLNVNGNTGCQFSMDTNYNNLAKNIAVPNKRNNTFNVCVKASVYLRMVLTTQIDNNNKSEPSDPIYLKVDINDGCWAESRLKTSVAYSQLIGVGTAVAIDGNWSAIAAPRYSTSTVINAGAVYMFEKVAGEWTHRSTIVPQNAVADDTISAIALSGTRLAIGSSKRNTTGAVAIYDLVNSEWTFQGDVVPPSPHSALTGQKFSSSLAMNAKYLAIGAPNYSAGGAGTNDKSGLVYIFDNSGATPSFKMVIQSDSPGSAFGTSVALDLAGGDFLIAGAPQTYGLESLADGYAKVINIGGASPVLSKKLAPTDSKADALGMRYGQSVALNGTKAVVGASLRTNGTNLEAGGIYYYANYATSTQVTRGGDVASANLGQSLAFTTSGLLVGCPYCNNRAGQAWYYAFDGSGNIPTAVSFLVFALNDAANDGFGYSVATSGTDIAVGAHIKSDPNNNSGAAYVYGMK